MVQDLPHRAAGWNVRGQRLAVGNSGTGLDVIVDWIAGPDELVSEGRRPLNRLMGFSARGELPAFVLYATPTSASAFTPVAESSLHDVLDIVASRDDLRAKFRCVTFSFLCCVTHNFFFPLSCHNFVSLLLVTRQSKLSFAFLLASPLFCLATTSVTLN